MPNGDTNPNIVSLGRVFTEIRDLRKENKIEHKTISQTLSKHSIQLACLETKWATFWRVTKYAAPIVGAAIGAGIALRSLL